MAQRNLKQARLGAPGNEEGAGAGATPATAAGRRVQLPATKRSRSRCRAAARLAPTRLAFFRGSTRPASSRTGWRAFLLGL
ncbi:MAG: Ferredoxin reductase [uncultured Paraburkholderia sp.]|nr:MAG: Ferredoxin reductase [uncultured Paraburkholderia sp.]CAH2919617.1 MAG: Ferredoxin reductase [uncultured Paraburkholderia sp.]